MSDLFDELPEHVRELAAEVAETVGRGVHGADAETSERLALRVIEDGLFAGLPASVADLLEQAADQVGRGTPEHTPDLSGQADAVGPSPHTGGVVPLRDSTQQ